MIEEDIRRNRELVLENIKKSDSFIYFGGGIYEKKDISIIEKTQESNVINGLNAHFKNMK